MSINFANKTYEIMIDNFAKVIIRTPITKTISNISGDEELINGTPVNISGAFFRKDDSWSQGKEGLFQGADAILLVKKEVIISKDDKISFDSEDYRILNNPITRRLGTTIFYIMARCFKV